MQEPTVTTTPKATVHIDAHKFAHPMLERDIIVGTSTGVFPDGKKTVAVVSINKTAIGENNYPDWQETLNSEIMDLLVQSEQQQEALNWIENSIYAHLKGLGIEL